MADLQGAEWTFRDPQESCGRVLQFSIPVETFLGGEGRGDCPQGPLDKCCPHGGLGLPWTEMTIVWLMRQVQEVWREGSWL